MTISLKRFDFFNFSQLFNGQNFFRTVEKRGKLKPFGHSRASKKNKKIPHFDHFPRPGESDPFVVVPNISAVTKFCKVLVPFRCDRGYSEV